MAEKHDQSPRLVRCVTSDGWRLQLRRHPVEGTPRAVALLLHAMMVDGRTFERAGGGLAGALGEAGILPFVADLRGRGGSPPTVAEGGRWSYADLAHRDLPALIAAVREAAPGLPLFVVGHSLGGHLAIAAATREPALTPEGFVLLAANIWMPALDRHPLRRLGRSLSIAGFQAATRLAGHFPSRTVKMGPVNEAWQYVHDLAGFWWSGRWGSAPEEDYLAAARQLTAPALAVFGAGDRLMAHPVGGRAWAERIGPSGAEIWVEGRESGLDFDPGHMGLVTDSRARPLWERISSWVLARSHDHRSASSGG